MGEYYIPTVFERDGRTERSWDVYSRLLKDRIVFIGTPITGKVVCPAKTPAKWAAFPAAAMITPKPFCRAEEANAPASAGVL